MIWEYTVARSHRSHLNTAPLRQDSPFGKTLHCQDEAEPGARWITGIGCRMTRKPNAYPLPAQSMQKTNSEDI
jgi:hypothetical protein